MLQIKGFISYILGIIFLGILLSGCSYVTPLHKGADRIKLIDAKNGNPTNLSGIKNCKFLGKVSTFDKSGVTHTYTSDKHLVADHRNEIRNKALSLGANTVVLSQSEIIYRTPRKNITVVDTHKTSGNAYLCPNG